MAVGNAAGAEIAGDAEFSLLAGLGALTGELFRILGVVDHAVFFQTRHHHLDQQLVIAAALQLALHLMHRMRAAHQRPHRHLIQLLFGFELARLGEHEERMR